jgi:hypothetical protein
VNSRDLVIIYGYFEEVDLTQILSLNICNIFLNKIKLSL